MPQEPMGFWLFGPGVASLPAAGQVSCGGFVVLVGGGGGGGGGGGAQDVAATTAAIRAPAGTSTRALKAMSVGSSRVGRDTLGSCPSERSWVLVVRSRSCRAWVPAGSVAGRFP